MKSGTATGGGTDNLVDTALLSLFNDDFFKASGIVIVDTTDDLAPEKEKRTIRSSDQGTSKVMVFPNFTVTVGSGDLYEIYKGLSVDDVEDAVNEATRMAAAGFWEPVVDETKTWTTNTLVVDLSGLTAPIDPLYDVDYVGVQLISSPATYPYADVTDQVVFFWDGTTPKIQFFQEMPSGAKIKVCYRTRPTEMTSQEKTTGVTYADLDIYLRVQAVEQLVGGAFFGPGSNDTDWRKERWGVQKAEVIFDKYRMPEPIGRVQTVAPHIPGGPLSRFSIRIGE